MTELEQAVVDALSRLNEHARAWGFGRKAIYAYKTAVAAELATDVRPVQVMVRCNHCAGTGRYADQNEYVRGACYRCTNGVATLLFVESQIERHCWHHPYDKGGSEVLDAVWDIVGHEARNSTLSPVLIAADGSRHQVNFKQAEGWGPNMPGAERLPTDEACRLLNIVEDWLLADWRQREAPRRPRSRWPLERARRAILSYRVALEQSDEGECCVCGTADILPYRCGGSTSQWRGGWAADFYRHMCRTCHGPNNEPRWPKEPAPASLTPDVLAWLARPERAARPFVQERSYD